MLASSDSIWFSELRGAILLLMAAPPAKLRSTCFPNVHRSIDCCFFFFLLSWFHSSPSIFNGRGIIILSPL
jgi:hypothetical protein